jgi:hypothetical protein
MDPHAVIDAERTLAILSGAKSERVHLMSTQLIYYLAILPDVVTDQVVEIAKNRAHVMRNTRELFLLFVFV